MTIQEAIEQALRESAKITSAPVPVVTEERVAHIIGVLGKRGYVPTAGLAAIIKDYAAGYGLLLHGDVGHGKTHLLKCLRAGKLYTAEMICDYGIAHLSVWLEDTNGEHIIIDDLGAEATTCEYGAKEDLMKKVISRRAELRNVRTYVTTNLDAAGIIARYGERIMSRLLGMCRPHKVVSPTGKSMRRAVPVKPLDNPAHIR